MGHSVEAMTTTPILDKLAAMAPLAAAMLREIKSAGLDKTELAAKLDITITEASLRIAVAKVFDEDELRLAEELKLSFAKLHTISSTTKRLSNPDVDPRNYRETLMHDACGKTCAELKQQINAEIKQLNDGHCRPRKSWLRYSSIADDDGMKYLIAKIPTETATRLQESLTPQARQLVVEKQAVDEAEGHAKALIERALGHYDITTLEELGPGENPDNPRDLRQRPCYLIPLFGIQENIDGTITDSNGSIVNIHERVSETLNEYGFAVAIYRDKNGHPRPQKVFEVKRLADADDRLISVVSHLVCQNPHCTIPAVRCNIHHITAYSRGGETTNDNLCPLCRYHNLRNDDDPDHIQHGRVVTDPKTGTVWFRHPDGTIARNRHPANHRNALTYAQEIFEICDCST